MGVDVEKHTNFLAENRIPTIQFTVTLLEHLTQVVNIIYRRNKFFFAVGSHGLLLSMQAKVCIWMNI
jgi:hypothetical protein